MLYYYVNYTLDSYFLQMKLAFFVLFTAFATLVGYSQLCNGSFGDPVFEETFGNNSASGGNYAGPLPAGTTSYSYNGNGNTQDGSYTVTTSPILALSNWFNTPDHTVDTAGQGYMLVVNADANSTGEFYRKSVTNLCGSLVYQFSAYFMNVLSVNGPCNPAIPCNVKFSVQDVNGNELGSISTGNIPSVSTPQWINYTFEFQIPEGNDSVTVVLINNALGGCGNDLAIDDITFRTCGSLATVSTDFADFVNGVCETDVVNLTANINADAYDNPAFQWQQSTDGGTTYTNIAGATNSSVTVTNFVEGQKFRYLVFEAQNINSPNCQVASEAITVNIYDTPANAPNDLELCDTNQNGVATFNLNQVKTTVLGGASVTDFTVTFHHSQTAATNGTGAITNPGSYQNTADGETIYVRVVNNDKGCYNTTSFKLLINELPDITTPVILQQCDDDTDGISAFNLEEAIPLIANNTYTYTFYKTEAAAQSENSIYLISNPTAYTNTNSNYVYVNVKTAKGCSIVATVELQVSTSQIPDNFQTSLELCDSAADGSDVNGIEYFDLSVVTSEILSLFANNTGLNVTYYTNEADALAETNAINASHYLNSGSPFSQWLYVRIDDQTNNSCFGLKRCVELVVHQLPEFELDETQEICLNQIPYPISIYNAAEDYEYTWYNPNGQNIGHLTYAYATMAGEYSVVASTGGNSHCSRTKTILITASDAADITRVEVEDATDFNTIVVTAEGPGEYEYSLNGLFYQDSPIFENLVGGTYNIYVRDKKGCGVTTQQVCVVAFPAYFSPNGDGVNDSWTAINLADNCSEGGIINIFDRYGKLIKQVSLQEGWDGTYDNIAMPSTDYWFTAILPQQNNRSIKGHFSLKR